MKGRVRDEQERSVALAGFIVPALLRPPLAGRGAACIASLWIAILLTILAFFQVSPLAGWLLVPYLLWVTFASGLNFTIWRLNG